MGVARDCALGGSVGGWKAEIGNRDWLKIDNSTEFILN